jgi:hypothetical protein
VLSWPKRMLLAEIRHLRPGCSQAVSASFPRLTGERQAASSVMTATAATVDGCGISWPSPAIIAGRDLLPPGLLHQLRRDEERYADARPAISP